ncbi:MAG: ComF family protein [Planctomycetota bacterium]
MKGLGGAIDGCHAFGRGLADLLLPGVCAACGSDVASAEGLCDTCNVELLAYVAVPYCPRCGSSLGPNIPASDEGCWSCPATLPRYVRTVRVGPYAGPLRSAVRELKYHHRDAVRRRLGEMLAEAVVARCEGETFDAVVPIESHWRRRLARGCDHARRLAEAVARPLATPVGRELVRIRHTPPQTRLSRTQRIENVRKAFAPRNDKTLAGARLLLVDDVTTTGATANEAARTLLTGGALRVTLAVLAKSEPPTAYADRSGT